MVNKVFPSKDKRGPQGILVAGEPSVSRDRSRGPSLETLPAYASWRICFSRLRIVQPLVEIYRRVPWTTRQTVTVAFNLYVLLYLFVSVPFRIAFYYSPRSTTNVDEWTQALSVFSVADGVADMIGFVQFLDLRRSWRRVQARNQQRPEKASMPDVPATLLRTPSGLDRRRGKARWTIATIATIAASSSANGIADAALAQQEQNLLVRNVEFALELVALVPIEAVLVSRGDFNVLHLVRATKLCRLYKVRRCLVRITELYAGRAWVQHISSIGVDSLVRTIGVCVGLCHWVACGYMLLGHLECGIDLEACEEHVETSWVVRDRLFGATVARKYSRTLYWATRTLVLLGYDDVTPVSNAETLYVVIVTLLGALVGSSLLANFLFLFRSRNARYAAFAAHVDNAREYMRSRNIPRAVRHQVTAYFSYTWNTHGSLDSEEALRLMPKHLQWKVVSTLKASRIKQVCFLAKESVEFTNMLALALVRRVYSPGDQIIEPKINAETFFVIRGKVVLSAFNGSNAKECLAGDFFGDICLLYPERYEQKAMAKTFCELYVLAKSKFDGALTEFYRGSEADVRSRMAETLDKFDQQLSKMKKLLGVREAHESGGRKSSITGSSHRLKLDEMNSLQARRGVSWRFPGSYFTVFWDTARLVAIIYVAFEVPYFAVFISITEKKDVFNVQAEVSLRYVLTLLVEVFFGVDLLLRSRYFTYLDPNVMLNVVQPHLIFEAYKAKGFYVDLLAWLPVGVVLDALPASEIQRYSACVRLLRLFRVRLVPELLRDLTDYYGTSSKLLLVVSLILGVTLMLHIVGCIWFQMTLLGQDSASVLGNSAAMSELTRSECLRQATLFQNCSWVKFDCYSHIGEVFPAENPASMYQSSFAYMRSVYWAIVTLTAVGYGDIVAYSTAESFFAALWVFVGGIINFGVVGAMSSTISNALAPHHHHMEKLNTVNTVLERMEISEKLSADIRHFYHHQFVGRKRAYESQLLSHLPDQLCYEISSLLHSDAVKSVPLFDSASLEFLKDVTGKFRHRSYQNGETICLEGDVCREFFVLLDGSRVNVFFRLRKVPIRALRRGDCYGVNEFLLRRPHHATLTAASLVHASVMTREQFDVIQRKFSEDVNDMKSEAEVQWTEEHKRLGRIVANLEKLKLQTHLMHTPTLFYQRESAIIPKGSRRTSCAVYSMRSAFTSLWYSIITCWNVYNAIFIIFHVCFHSFLHCTSATNAIISIVDFACDACFAVDIYLRLYYFGCSEVVGVGNLITRKVKNKRYFRSSTLKWDVLASLPIYASSGSYAACLCRLPRLIRCVDLWKYLDEVVVKIQQQFASHNVSAYLSPAKLMLILVLVAHYVGCIFFLISEHECEHVARCWIAHDHMLHEYHHSVPILYAKSFYWAITTLLLVGSRESVPRDMAGTLWTGFTCLCCTFIIGHIVGEISELILELGKETKQYKSHIASFEGFAKDQNLPVSLRERVTYFFRVQFEHTKGSDLFRTVHDLSANLRLQLMLEIYGRSIANLPICRFLTASQVNNLALRLKPELFIPGDNILVEGTYGSRLCTLRKGLAAAFWTKAVAAVAILMEGALFGEIAFFLPNQPRLATVRATTFCEVLSVSKHDWQELWSTSGNASDNQMQKHALHAILGWVRSRLQRYQRASLRTAGRAKRLLSDEATDKVSTRKGLRTKTRGSSHDATNGKSTTGLTPRSGKLSVAEVCRLFVPPETQLLEKKAEYLLAKSDACVSRFSPSLQARSSSLVAAVRSSILNSLSTSTVSRNRATSHGAAWNSANIDASPLSSKANNGKVEDIRLRQFIVDLSPVNKYVGNSLGKSGLQAMEEECWVRYRLLAEAQHVVSNLLVLLFPPATGTRIGRSCIKTPSGKMGIRRHRTWLDTSTRRKSFDEASPTSVKALSIPDRAGLTKVSQLLVGFGGKPTVRRFSGEPSTEQGKAIPSSETELAATLIRMTRCRSLPAVEVDFFRGSGRSKTMKSSRRGNSGIDFEILQRCQRPQYATQLQWYHQYRQWRDRSKVAVVPQGIMVPLAARAGIVIAPKRNKSLVLAMGGPRVAAMGSRLHLPSQRALLSASTDLQLQQFIRRVKDVGKAWDLAMLIVAVYHVIVTPFKVSFAPAILELPARYLWKWSALEMCFDLFSLLDVAYRVHHAAIAHQGSRSDAASSFSVGFHHALESSSELGVDLFAMLPLELLLLASGVRVPVSQSAVSSVDASWWSTRWLLRLNRMLLIRRVEPLSEQLFQYVIHDLKLPVSEAVLYFMRGLSSYLATGHILACIWFGTSEIGFHHYGASWLATSGMLTYIPDGADVVEHTARALAEAATTFSLESVSLARKYLRSLLFSMECISTLFYGDILSMNPLELIAEIAITLWSIYIYGALVGAQAELLNARAKREAMFEQRLGELQHYVVQNGVPKSLKRHIKAYYARLWRRCRGESDFAAVACVSRVLYEDVVMLTLRRFAAQVKAFRGLDEHFLRSLLVCLQYVVCDVGEEVVMKGDVDRSMYFIAQGRILVSLDSAEMTRERGEFFGELTLLYGISRLESCVAVTVAELYRLDDEPYERLLLEYPEYRARNKLAWTTSPETDGLGSPPHQTPTHTTLALRPSIAKVNVTTRENVDARLPFSFVYTAAMTMLAKVQTLHPLEAKDLILKCREGARKQLMRGATPESDENGTSLAQVNNSEGGQDTKPSARLATVMRLFGKTRAFPAQAKVV
ncbi:hypothetical protein PHYPSEUDO_014798 [Phytophthora pseudosyringae]|uniref:Cyclic nucleotide-binding domain-containing protein n=1 Tax=Phytophthora pseudosyringae TaxID=221518 RepID=A0A8T1W376_9STRA|nr:hypothetical protein PHYPSEUDO_014798 [Phytophthora pseudosyringae]